MSGAQDPAELFDVVTFQGVPTGIRKRRADVHRDGDWHRAIHIWVIGMRDGAGFFLLQRRSLAKDTSPGLLDPTVGGHRAAGETWQEALREAEEEIGLVVSEDDVVYAGSRRGLNESGGLLDRELQDVYFVRNDAPLSDYRPNPAELDSLVQITVDDALLVLSGQQMSAPVELLNAATRRLSVGDVGRDELDRTFDRYVFRVAIAARAFLDGERYFSV